MNQNYYVKIGETIKELRLKNNMTKTQLAKGICSVSYITRIENGERCPTSVILRQITNKLGISSEYLFRVIESPTSVEVNKLLNLIFHYYERREPHNIYKLIKAKEKELHITSIHDAQIIETFKCLSTACVTEDFQQGLHDMKIILNRTYTKGTNPNDIEFLQLFFYSFFLSSNGQTHESYELLMSLKKHLASIKYFHCYAILPDFYTVLVESCLSIHRFDDCFTYIEKAINYCKQYNVHALLRQLYGLKGELYCQLNKVEEAIKWFDKAIILNQLICTTDKDSEFAMFPSIKRLEKLIQS